MPIALFALVVATSAQEWPSFRRPNASGVADGQNLPVQLPEQFPIDGAGEQAPLLALAVARLVAAIETMAN
jgi:hypothetical protein